MIALTLLDTDGVLTFIKVPELKSGGGDDHNRSDPYGAVEIQY